MDGKAVIVKHCKDSAPQAASFPGWATATAPDAENLAKQAIYTSPDPSKFFNKINLIYTPP